MKKTLAYLALAYVLYFVARMAYLLENWSYFAPGLSWSSLSGLMRGSLLFDTSAIMLTNIPVIVLLLLTPWHRIARWAFLVINGIALAMNLCDAVYFKYTLRRTTVSVFSEFHNENNLFFILITETARHWNLVLLFVVAIWLAYKLTSRCLRVESWGRRKLLWGVVSLLVLAPFVVAGIRGGFTTAVRPITISNANQYVQRPTDAALVLNTPFSIYRTIGKNVFTVTKYFEDDQKLETIYSPIHHADTTAISDSAVHKKNVVILIVESFGREYIGALNKTLENGKYKGYTPFTDSLISRSVTFTRSYCNGRKSIDAMPSILSGIPMFVEPFILTPASMNSYTGIAGILGAEGYQTAFFHGAQRNSMGFQAFARKTGFQQYYGREDYCADNRFRGDNDFDGTWAIWDEPFMQYFATKMSDMHQPFMTALFTATSHHPYHVPDAYKEQFPEEGIIIHKCIRYTDHALRRFFETSSRQPWFNNTIFVLTSDHTNLSDHDYYQTDLGGFSSPIIIFTPDGQLQPEIQDRIAQQTDIMPTILGMLRYQKPFLAFGIDLFNTEAKDTWAVNYLNGVYQFVNNGHVLQFDGQKTVGFYNLTDSLMQRNLMGTTTQQQSMERTLKAIIQQYMERMVNDRLMPISQ